MTAPQRAGFAAAINGKAHRPPPGLADCVPCIVKRGVNRSCPRCLYELGYADGASK